MLTRIKPGDLVVVKNVPEYRWFTIVEIGDGGYQFDMPTRGDFAHCLPCRVRSAPFKKNSVAVPVPFVSALNREQNPIRITNKHRKVVQDLAGLPGSMGDHDKTNTLLEDVESWRQELVDVLRKRLRASLHHKSTERLVDLLLRRLFGDGVSMTAGPAERGADFICDVPVGLGQSVKFAIQVKMHWGQDWDLRGLEQLEEAFSAHDAQRGLLLSMADEMSESVQAKLEELRAQYDIHILSGDELYGHLLELVADPNVASLLDPDNRKGE
jgi:hypothetical protein